MSAQEWVLVCALQLLGRSADRLPPIKVVDVPPADVSRNAQGFLSRQEGIIYLIASAPSFRLAESSQKSPLGRGQCIELRALKMIASIIVHEEWHLKHGPDEKGAYQAQLMQLQLLGLGSDTRAIYDVTKAMQAVLEANASRQHASSHIAFLVTDHEHSQP